jgi:xylulokinase
MPGTPVIIGTTDAAAEAVSIGVTEPGDMMLMYGSTIFMTNVASRLKKNEELWSGVYLFENSYAVTSAMATTGSLTRWIRDTFAKDLLEKEKAEGENSYTALFKEAENIPAGSEGLIVLPYFSGERMPIKDPNARGVFFGLNLSHSRGHIIKAALEGIGYGLSQNLELMRGMGCSLDSITAVGGGTKSRLWMQIMSDICGIEQRIPEVTVGASYGDALLAGLGIGAISSAREIKKLIKTKYITTPNKDYADIYNKNKRIYKELYGTTKDMMHEL